MDNNTGIKHSDTDITLVEPPKIHNMHSSSDTNLSAATRQASSMSNIDLGMHTIPPRIITKDASYSFIWIDDHYKNLSKLETISHDRNKISSKVSKRGFCNLFTIIFIISIILFLFLYPFITFYILPIYNNNK